MAEICRHLINGNNIVKGNMSVFEIRVGNVALNGHSKRLHNVVSVATPRLTHMLVLKCREQHIQIYVRHTCT